MYGCIVPQECKSSGAGYFSEAIPAFRCIALLAWLFLQSSDKSFLGRFAPTTKTRHPMRAMPLQSGLGFVSQ